VKGYWKTANIFLLCVIRYGLVQPQWLYGDLQTALGIYGKKQSPAVSLIKPVGE
jgi:hypothetical protein